MEQKAKSGRPFYLAAGSPEMAAVHALQLEMLLLVDKLCRDYDLKYYLIFGSLLGAVRHGGFIPWDDDIDIGLLRSDYDQLADLLATEVDPQVYFFQTAENDGGITIPYAKLRCHNTLFEEWQTPPNALWQQGVFLDIFPLDAVPDEPGRAAAMRRQFLQAHMGLRYKLEGYRSDKVLYNLAYKLLALPSVPTLLAKRHRALIAGAGEKTDRVLAAPASPADYESSYLGRAELEPACDLDFCGHPVMVPHRAEVQLAYLFGDYMSLPPEEQRRGHALRSFYIDENFWAPVLNRRLVEVR